MESESCGSALVEGSDVAEPVGVGVISLEPDCGKDISKSLVSGNPCVIFTIIIAQTSRGILTDLSVLDAISILSLEAWQVFQYSFFQYSFFLRLLSSPLA